MNRAQRIALNPQFLMTAVPEACEVLAEKTENMNAEQIMAEFTKGENEKLIVTITAMVNVAAEHLAAEFEKNGQ